MTTLPAMSDELLDELAIDKDGLPNSHLEFARAIIAARDAQWAAAVDAAVMQERESILDECLHTCGAVTALELSKAIRARTKEKT